MTIIGIDFGDRRVGIAKSEGVLASGVCTVKVTGIEDAVEKTAMKIQELGGTKIVLGLPRNMDGSYGFQSERVKEFADAVLKLWDGEHAFFDERLTTVSAERVLMEAELDWRKRRKVVDKLAATIILQGYLDSNPRL